MIDVYKKEVGRMRGSLMDDKPYFCIVRNPVVSYAFRL